MKKTFPLDNVTPTIEYYDHNATSFTDSTVSVDFSATQSEFLSRLLPNAHILDFGCGSGRDARLFMEQGFSVDAIDGSAEMCRFASEYTGLQVRQMMFQDFDAEDTYDGIWACASLLHLTYTELENVFPKIEKALHTGGIMYASFKYGKFEGMRNGRYFTDMDEESFSVLIEKTGRLQIEKLWISTDVRPGREDEKWLNVLLRKI